MKSFYRKAFTLAELLIVVIVIAVLASVAVPKFSRVLESRKTAEAEEMLTALRTEQEKRCIMGENYTKEREELPVLASLDKNDNSANYNYELGDQGAEATSRIADRTYSLKMLSYRDGRICCEGAYCSSLNKNYESCATLEAELASEEDECSPEEEEILPITCSWSKQCSYIFSGGPRGTATASKIMTVEECPAAAPADVEWDKSGCYCNTSISCTSLSNSYSGGTANCSYNPAAVFGACGIAESSLLGKKDSLSCDYSSCVEMEELTCEYTIPCGLFCGYRNETINSEFYTPVSESLTVQGTCPSEEEAAQNSIFDQYVQACCSSGSGDSGNTYKYYEDASQSCTVSAVTIGSSCTQATSPYGVAGVGTTYNCKGQTSNNVCNNAFIPQDVWQVVSNGCGVLGTVSNVGAGANCNTQGQVVYRDDSSSTTVLGSSLPMQRTCTALVCR